MFFMKHTTLNSLLVLPILIVLVATSSILAQPNTNDAKQAPEKVGSPVVLSGETLFYVYDRIGPFEPEDRAKAITDRLTKLLNDPLAFRISPLKVDPVEKQDRGRKRSKSEIQ